MSSFKTTAAEAAAEGIFLSRGDKLPRECSRKLLTADRNAASTQLQWDMIWVLAEFLLGLSTVSAI